MFFWFHHSNSTAFQGRPPKWTPLKSATKLPEDNGKYFRDRNAAQFPAHPIEPAVIASMAADPALPSKVDIVACGGTLSNLLRFARGEEKAFRISAELVNGTAFLIRHENSPTEIIPDVRGYGHSFPEAYTTWDRDVKGSLSHQRVISYTFGGLNILVRFEPDGYITQHSKEKAHVLSEKAPYVDTNTSLDEINRLLSENTVTTKFPTDSMTLTVLDGGSPVDQASVFDLKTRASWKQHIDILGEELPRLWIAQISKFILGFHENGVFNKIQVRDVADNVKKWEKGHASELSNFAALLHRVIDLLLNEPSGRLEFRHSGNMELAVYAQLPEVNKALSPSVEKRWKEAWLAEHSDEK